MSEHKPPVVSMDVSNNEVKRGAGFYVIVVCSGNFGQTKQRKTHRTGSKNGSCTSNQVRMEVEVWSTYILHSQDMEAVWCIDRTYIQQVKGCNGALERWW